jgi:hypothetical protein
MIPQKVKDIELLRSISIDHSDECFHVEHSSDSAGSHYVLYLVEGTVDIDLLMKTLSKTGIRRTVIILSDKQTIQYKINEELMA